MGNLKLISPIEINGKNVKELTYDTNEITVDLYIKAETQKFRQGVAGNRAGAAEIDYGLHLNLGFAAIIAVNSDIDWSDLERVKGRDIVAIGKIGRDFFTKSADDSQADNSDEPSESTQGSTTNPSGESDEEAS